MRQDDAILVMLDIAGLGGFAGAQIPSVELCPNGLSA